MALDLSDPEVAHRMLVAAMTAPEDPALNGPYPRGLALDLVLGTCDIADIPEMYQLPTEQVAKILQNPLFRREYENLQAEMEKDGWSFKQKARIQAEALLETSWKMIHDANAPAGVRADLLKQTIKWAGLEPKDTPAPTGIPQNVSEAVESLRQMDDATLEIRVAQILVRKNQPNPASDPLNTPAPGRNAPATPFSPPGMGQPTSALVIDAPAPALAPPAPPPPPPYLRTTTPELRSTAAIIAGLEGWDEDE